MNNNSNTNNSVRGSFNFANPGGFQMHMRAPPNFGQQQPPNQQPPQTQPQAQPRPYFPGHFQPPDRQAQSFVQPQTVPIQLRPPAVPQNLISPNMGIPSPAVSTPNSGTAKRLHRPPSRAAGGSVGQGTGTPMKTMELAPAVRRAKRKLPEKVIPEKIAAILPESALYAQLVECESRVDAFLAQKKAYVEEWVKNPVQKQKILRIFVSNTFTSQIGAGDDDKGNSEPPSWCLRIVGRVLEGGNDNLLDGVSEKPSDSYPELSFFVKKISVYLDQNLYPENHMISWEGSKSAAQREGFEVKRKGDKEFTAIIRLEVNYGPDKFKLSSALQEVLGIEIETRSRVLAAIWQYIKVRKLQIPGDTSLFMCDPPLRNVFGEERVKFSMVKQRLAPHLSPPGPIHLEHRVKLSGNNPTGNTCYDILVDVPLPLQKEMSNFLGNLETDKEIEAYDETISSAVKKMHEHCRRRAFFLGFSESPAEFTNALIASQARDLKLTANDSARDSEKERKADFYRQPWMEEAVLRYLNRKPAAGN